MLDVGQGDAILLRTDDKAVLIDAGDRGSNTERQLRLMGIEHLDLVIATHPHADHIGRMAEVIAQTDIDLYMDNGLPHTTMTYTRVMQAMRDKSIKHIVAKQGMVLNMGDEATLTILHPDEEPLTGTRSDLNSNSVVVLLEHDGISMMFTGDAEEPTEHELLEDGVPDIDVLKVAHHGSSHSTTSEFLSAAQPEIALISVGTDNRYKHPKPDCLQRLSQHGAMVFRTDWSHHVRVISDGENIEVVEGSLEEILGIRPITDWGPVAAILDPGSSTITPVVVERDRTKKELRQQRRAERKAARIAKREKRQLSR
jgi:competence protein ComEC